jgi:predicted enzyme related to lactoylglutathione lyase
MVEFSSHPAGSPCWVDLMSPDVDASKAFYSAVFGWDAEDQFDDEGNRIYTQFMLGGLSVAGLGGQPPGMEGAPAIWNSYISVEDCAATATKVTAAGGTVMMPPTQIMTAGEMAIFADPTGAAISVWKGGDHIGAEIGNIVNTYSWNELLTRDVETAKTFYSEVFGWEYDVGAMPDGSYNLIKGGDEGWGGLMAMPDEMPDMVPNHWAVYFTVADVAATVDAIKANGGQIVQEPFDIPNIGTCAVIHDPAAGNFNVMQPVAA